MSYTKGLLELKSFYDEEKEYENDTISLFRLKIKIDELVSNYNPKTGVELIEKERARQVEVENRTIALDIFHNNKSELALAAAAYALPDNIKDIFGEGCFERKDVFPWNKNWWKPSPDNRIRELEKAGALIAAEIDRLKSLPETDSAKAENINDVDSSTNVSVGKN